MKKRIPWNKDGGVYSQETLKKMSDGAKRRWASPENRQIHSELHKDQQPWNTGKKRPEMTGINNPKWKGDKVGYHPLHQWVVRNLGSAKKCTECGLDAIPKEKKRYFQWANISGEYKRDLSDWIELCVLCHKAYDLGRLELTRLRG